MARISVAENLIERLRIDKVQRPTGQLLVRQPLASRARHRRIEHTEALVE